MTEIKEKIIGTYGRELVIPEQEDNGYKPAAVLVPLFREDGRWQVLFTKRTDKVDAHKGQISFPGGVRDPEDPDLIATAVRETGEEIGVAPADIELLASLEPTATITNYMVYPFVGVIPYPYPFKLNSFEVARLIKLPLDELIAEACDQYPASGPLELSVRFNRLSDDVVWGATARILYRFLETAFLDAEVCK